MVRVFGRLKCLLGIVICGIVMLGVSFSASAFADEERPQLRLQASPSSLDFGELSPGKTYTKVLRIQNTGSENLKYKMGVSPFTVVDETYDQDFATETEYNDIVRWITFSQYSGEVEPDSQDEITVTVKVPQDVPAGGQYAAVTAQIVDDSESEIEGSSISTVSQVAVLVYSSIDGETRKEGSVVENKVPSFMFAPPIRATSVVENTGNVHAEAQYILQVYPLFGSEEVYTNEEQPASLTIMPETRRLNTIAWDGAPQLGIFKVKQTVKFLGEDNVTEKLVFICPIWFLFIIIVLVFLVVFWIVSRVRGRKE